MIEHLMPRYWNDKMDWQSFRGFRTKNFKYVNYYYIDDCEFYDLEKDPYEMNNLCSQLDPVAKRKLKAKLKELVDCTGASCRIAEDKLLDSSEVVPPAGGPGGKAQK